MYQIVTLFLNYWSFRVKLQTSPSTNITSLVLHTSTFDEQLYIFAYLSAVTIPSFTCMVTIVVGTILLVIKLKKSAQWRMNTATSVNRGEGICVKEMRLVRIVVFICGIFIACFSPNMFVFFYICCLF